MQAVKAGALYFALVFGAGFVLGTVRTLWVVPRVGARTAELMEMPIMLAVTIVAARWTVLRLSVPIMWSARLGMGCMALVLMLIAEFGFVLWIRGLTLKQYFATREPVAGAAYYLLLAGATFWWIVAGVLQVSVIPFTLIVILPTNKLLLSPTLDRRSVEAERLLARWGRLHAVEVRSVDLRYCFSCT